jgi:rare lipoprotein A (peptidoglycan hydrolase)
MIYQKRATAGLLALLSFAIMQGCSTLSGNVGPINAPALQTQGRAIGTGVPTPAAAPASRNEVSAKTPATHFGEASWYGPGFNRKQTASGDIFDETKMTAAHKTLPLGTKATVTNLQNGKSVEVEINDRGPYVDGRIIDLSKAAATKLGFVDRGTAMVRIDLLEKIAAGNTVEETASR